MKDISFSLYYFFLSLLSMSLCLSLLCIFVILLIKSDMFLIIVSFSYPSLFLIVNYEPFPYLSIFLSHSLSTFNYSTCCAERGVISDLRVPVLPLLLHRAIALRNQGHPGGVHAAQQGDKNVPGIINLNICKS